MSGPPPVPPIEYPEWLRPQGEGPRPSPPVGTAPPSVPPIPGPPSVAPPTGPPGAAPPKSDTVSGIADFFATVSDVLGWVLDPKVGIPGAAAYVSFITGISKEALGTGLNVVGAVMTAIGQYRESTATTVVGKTVDAAGAGALDWGLGTIHPALPVVDKAVGLFFEHVVGVKGISIADTLNTSVRSIVTLGEGLITGDTRGMEAFHEKSMAGDYGPIFQASSEAGEYWADHGIVGGLSEFGSALGDWTGWW